MPCDSSPFLLYRRRRIEICSRNIEHASVFDLKNHRLETMRGATKISNEILSLKNLIKYFVEAKYRIKLKLRKIKCNEDGSGKIKYFY